MSTVRYLYGTGKRKTAVARVRLLPGDGQIIVNGRPAKEYFGGRDVYQLVMQMPFQLTGTEGRYSASIKVAGGGHTGQAEAIRHGVSRALLLADEGYRPVLKSAGLLTRDARIKERKKVGLKRARKAPQYTKR